ncbi:MAG: hypothetical protein ACN4GT_15115 [Gammaproteobacteria bacterium]
MRSGFGRWILQHRGARVGLIAGLLPLPLTGVLSAAIVVAVAVSRGWREAVFDAVAAMVVLAIVTAFAGGMWSQMAISGASTWSLAILLGTLTGIYGSLTLALQVLLVIGLVSLVVFSLVVGDTIGFWEGVLSNFAEQMVELGVQFSEPDALLQLAPMMSGLVGASVVSTSMIALIIGAWWASGSGGPAFRSMFVQIRLGYVLGAVAVLAGIGTLFLPGEASGNALLLLGVGFVFQGLAVVHWLVATRGLPWIVLVPVYLPFFMGASISVMALFLLASAGFVDNWYNLRRAGSDGR